MARIRTIKPDFWTDEKIVELDAVERLLFIGLWNFADDQGYMDYSPKRIKMQVFPGDDVDVSRGLARLHEASLIRLYDSPQGFVLHVINWERHQRVSNPSRGRFVDGDLQECDWPGSVLASPLEDSARKGREGKGSTSPPSADADEDEDEADPFDEFWEHYPRKIEKQDALKAWRSALKKTTAGDLIEAVKAYPFSEDKKFIKYPAVWLNKGSWADTPDNVRPIRADDNPNAGKVKWAEVAPGQWQRCHAEGVYFGKRTVWLPAGQVPA